MTKRIYLAGPSVITGVLIFQVACGGALNKDTQGQAGGSCGAFAGADGSTAGAGGSGIVGVSTACGSPGQICCPGNSCNDGGCCISGQCTAAGTNCEGKDYGGTCIDGSCDSCGVRCGAVGQRCCGGSDGGSSGACTATGAYCNRGMCEVCGALGQACCQEGKTDTFYLCLDGFCAGADGGMICQNSCGGYFQPCCPSGLMCIPPSYCFGGIDGGPLYCTPDA
jgi:hypothetical protein